METPDLQKLAMRTRYMREAGIALTLGSLVLLVFLFVPLSSEKGTAAPIVVETEATPDAFLNVQVEAQAAVVYDLTNARVLYAKNADAQLPLASLTKLLTVYGALAELGPSTPITISEEAARAEPPHTFPVGATLKLSDLARLTLTGSLNDGAAALAEATAERAQVSTAAMLSAVAAALGLSETYALNGSGLDLSETIAGSYGSARDMAILAGAIVKAAPDVALATTLPGAEAVAVGGKAYKVKNTNPTVENAPRLLLSKTGLTDLAGGNLAIVFDVGIGHPVAVVVLGSSFEARFIDTQALVAATLAHFAGIASL